jgi:hypothetical protein
MALADHPANAARLSVALWVVVGLLAASAGPTRSTGADECDAATTVLPTTTPPAGTALRPR